jgi:hypothetical protein
VVRHGKNAYFDHDVRRNGISANCRGSMSWPSPKHRSSSRNTPTGDSTRTGTITNLTLQDLVFMARNGEGFIAYDARDGEDITGSVLAQVTSIRRTRRGTVAAPLVTLAGSLHKTVACYGKNAYFERT